VVGGGRGEGGGGRPTGAPPLGGDSSKVAVATTSTSQNPSSATRKQFTNCVKPAFRSVARPWRWKFPPRLLIV